MFYIRADANPTIATGHIMRCISIAKELTRLGENITFITADLKSKELIERNGYTILCLNSKWDNLEYELGVLIRIIKEKKIEKLLIDTYYVTEHYLLELTRYTKVVYIDDLSNFKYSVDMLINYNIYADNMGYDEIYSQTNTSLILGCKYAPLREESRDISTKDVERVKRILLTTGGADSCHIAKNFLTYLIENYFINEKKQFKEIQNTGMILNGPLSQEDDFKFSEIEYHIIVGKFNMDKEILQNLSDAYPNIILHYDVSNMSELMKQSNLAITAGGSTMYELCACGVPMITYSFADNQLRGVLGFERLGVAGYCGDIRDGEINLWENLVQAVKELNINHNYRKEISNRMKILVDGFGAVRLAKILIKDMH